MIAMSDSLGINSQVKNDSIIIKSSHKNDNIPPNTILNKPIVTSDSINMQITNKNIDISHQIFIKNQKDTINSTSIIKTYTYEPWNNIISVKSNVYKLISNEKVIYNVNENSIISFNSKPIKETLHKYIDYIDISNIILPFILTSFVLFVWIKISYNKYLIQLLRAIINYSDEAKLYNDQNIIIDRLYLLLNVIFTITGGSFIFYLIKYFNHEILIGKSFLMLFFCFGFIVSIYVYRYIINKIFGFILYQKQVFNEYLHSTFIYYKAMGLFLLPFIFIIYILSEKFKIMALLISLLIIFILYFISIFRATRIMLQKGILLFYWILYLCTVEFLPIILLYKLINSRV